MGCFGLGITKESEMAKDTPSMAKNKIRRSLSAIIDPHPTAAEVNELWSYFASSCAYCGVGIDRASRTGHMDHVDSSALGGSNRVHNHVLACAKCNGDEKREEHWISFLTRKAGSNAEERRMRIEAWAARGSKAPGIDPAVRAQAEAIIERTLGSFDDAVSQLRRLRSTGI